MPAQPGRAAFVFIFITVVLDMLALGVMVPVLPKLIVEFEGGDVASAAHMVGVFGFAWAAMQFVFSPLLGTLSDRYGRRPVILLSNLGMGLDYLLMALAPSLSWLFVGRLISGVTAASGSTASAYIADVTPPEQRAARFGMLGAAFGLGFIIGPAVGGLLGGIDQRLPFWVSAGLSLANAAYGLFILPESLPPERRTRTRFTLGSPLRAMRLLVSSPVMIGLTAAATCSVLAHESLPNTFVLYADHRYGWTEAQVGLVLAGIGVCTTVVSAAVVGPVVKRLGERAAITLGYAMGTIGFTIYGFAPTGLLFLAGLPMVALWGLAGPSVTAMMSRDVGPGEQGQLQGALGSLRGVTGMIGPLLFSETFALFVGSPLPGAAFVLSALLLGAALLLSRRAARLATLAEA